VDPRLLEEVLRHALDGVAVVAGNPGAARVVYANETLAGLLRRPEEWLEDRALDDFEIEVPADPTMTGAATGARVRLKRGDGSAIECERSAVLLADGRLVLYYRPASRGASSTIAAAMDRASGLSTPEHLMEVLRRDWSIAQRDGRQITVMRFDIDDWREYQDVFGRSASDKVLRQVGRAIATAMRRTSDIVARCGQDEFLMLGVAMDPENAFRFGEHIIGRVRALAIHHPRSRVGRYLTVSAGVVTAAPSRERGCETLLEGAEMALKKAKNAGGNRAVSGVAEG
jgi:diguanylate cyclase (GGDEF)-like protein